MQVRMITNCGPDHNFPGRYIYRQEMHSTVCSDNKDLESEHKLTVTGRKSPAHCIGNLILINFHLNIFFTAQKLTKLRLFKL